MKDRTLAFFPDPLVAAYKSKTFLHSPSWDHPSPCPILPGRGSSRVRSVSYALALPALLPSCCGSPCRSLHKFRSLAQTPSQPRTRAAQPGKRLHGTCLATAQGEIHHRSLSGPGYRSGQQIQWRISFQRFLIGIVSCVPLTSRLFF